MLTLDNTIYFDNDNDFFDYAVNPALIANQSDSGNVFYDFNFTDEYLNAVNNGMSFMIKDRLSKIYKHNCVSYKTLSKPVSNLKQYQGSFTDLILDKKLQLVQEEENQIKDDEE